jgi:hypothetical protein
MAMLGLIGGPLVMASGIAIMFELACKAHSYDRGAFIEASPNSVLLRCNESGCVTRTLDDLRKEIAGEGKLP